MPSWTIGLHTQTIGVSTEGERACSIADFVCGALEPRAFGPNTQLIATPLLDTDAGSAEELMRVLAMRLVWEYSQGLALHAAALARAGRVIVFPAMSGGGKSTLAVFLAARGWQFLTDELVFVPSGTSEVHALCRPAHLKPGSAFVVERFAALSGSPRVQRYAGGALIAPHAFDAFGGAAPLPLATIVYPEYAPEARLSIEHLSPGSACYALAAALVNARNLPQLGLAECARLTTCTPAYRLRYSDLDAAEQQLEVVVNVKAR